MDGQREFQSKVGNFFEQLSSRRDESYKQISDIINSHNSAIKEGIGNLVKKVSDLQDELSIMRNERNVLLETVENLNGEIRHLNAKMSITPSENIINQDITMDEETELQMPKTVVHDLESADVKIEADEETNESVSNHTVDKEIITSPENTLGDFVCPECKFVFSSNEYLIIHVKNIHPQLDTSEESQRGNEKSKCQRDISNDGIIERNMHDNMKKYTCEKCHYTTSRKYESIA